jgi:isopenicillin N synthase-like dioxygenase
LRHVLINVRFFYLKNHPLPPSLVNTLYNYVPCLFAVPLEEKDKISMANPECFLGYLREGKEVIHNRLDWREHFNFASPPDHKYIEGETPKEYKYQRYLGESQVSPSLSAKVNSF